MSFSIHINDDKQLLYVLGQGAITASDLDQYYIKLKTTNGVALCYKAIIDFSDHGVTFKHTPIKNIRALGLLFKHAPVLPEGAKMAVVVNNTLAFAFVRLFMATRGEHLMIRPFKHMYQALDWLDVSEVDIPQLDPLGKSFPQRL